MHGRGRGYVWQVGRGMRGRGHVWQGACVAGGAFVVRGDMHAGEMATEAGGMHSESG